VIPKKPEDGVSVMEGMLAEVVDVSLPVVVEEVVLICVVMLV
jgi:hypothetical protein